MAVVTDNRISAPAIPGVRVATLEEGHVLLDRHARRYLGISGDEFVRRWESGYYAADPDKPGVMDVAMLLPFVRRTE